jgi:hypothetical protein
MQGRGVLRIEPALVLKPFSVYVDNIGMAQLAVANAGIKYVSQNNASLARHVAEFKIYECVGWKPISLATVRSGRSLWALSMWDVKSGPKIGST